jgi:hypothetical protein
LEDSRNLVQSTGIGWEKKRPNHHVIAGLS